MGQGKSAAGKFKALILTLLVGVLAACQEKDNRSSVVVRAVGPRVQSQTSQPDTSNLQGRIYTDPYYQQGFQEAVVGLLSTDIRPEYIGYVSANGQNGSGVFFGGRVRLTSGSLTTGFGGVIASDSSIVIQVRDYAPQFQNVPPLPAIELKTAQGQISGNDVQIVFWDAYGAIEMRGQIDSARGVFTGVIKYDNNITYDGRQPGAAGNLGNFSIPICSFFAC